MRFKKRKISGRLNYKMTRKDWVLHLTATPSLIILANYFIWGSVYFTNAKIFVVATLLTSVMGLVLSFGNMRSMYFARSKYPALNQTVYRLLLSFLMYAVLDMLGGLLLLWTFSQLPFGGFVLTAGKVFNTMLVMLVAAAIAALGYEFFYSSEKWKESIRANEQLQRLQLHTELAVLKSQVNPHFLFNSLNSLSYLMADDVAKAETYLAEMTKVYRYLLRNNTVEITDLATELQFIKSYFAMLQTSYGSGIELLIEVQDRYMAYQVPPLTLQLLVENAVKHNAAHKHKPLTIHIYTTPKQELVVWNNLQKKLGKVPSNKVGLSNIAAKYQLMKQPEIAIAQTEAAFSVTLPLIAPTGTPSLQRLDEQAFYQDNH